MGFNSGFKVLIDTMVRNTKSKIFMQWNKFTIKEMLKKSLEILRGPFVEIKAVLIPDGTKLPSVFRSRQLLIIRVGTHL